MSKVLNFKPVHIAINPDRNLTFEPEGQEHLAQEDRLVYDLRPPTKRLLEEIQNGEIEMVIDNVGGDEQTGRVKTGTSRRLYIIHCLVGWKNLYTVSDEPPIDDEFTYDEVQFEKPLGQPASRTYEEAMMRNFERIPEDHVTGIQKKLKSSSHVEETVEKN